VELSMMEEAKDGWVFLHLLPRWQGDVSEEVFTHSRSLVWPLHENIYFATMAVILSELDGYQPIIPKPDFG
jgi:ornithine carbamoyltransferase